ncbi:hypothetical protein RintRC_5528 [Richelia intracellularis]|nr:hypothetical protein RintRC_5528 [Richelia intracellularis]
MPKMHSTQPNYLRISCHFINLHANIEVIEDGQHRGRGKPHKDSQPTLIYLFKPKLYPKKLQLPLPQNRLAGLFLPPMFLMPTNLATKMFYLNIRHNNLQNVVFGFSKTHCFLLPLCF